MQVYSVQFQITSSIDSRLLTHIYHALIFIAVSSTYDDLLGDVTWYEKSEPIAFEKKPNRRFSQTSDSGAFIP
ncbi:hypothetical protein HOLleu_15319 [Holothuria leucospilota]|uniref:Uncharacterized protein n=1 Tax=Holothuria leucospilota TaxID=206669 RepID=A0A9Q1CA33_HOLLE|nr:hypothetical protein HOLleu_15319 [Holothuria leucospilota]